MPIDSLIAIAKLIIDRPSIMENHVKQTISFHSFHLFDLIRHQIMMFESHTRFYELIEIPAIHLSDISNTQFIIKQNTNTHKWKKENYYFFFSNC